MPRGLSAAAFSCVLVLVLTTIPGCERYRHGLRTGTLAEVAVTSLRLIEEPGPAPRRWSLLVGNEAVDGACLQMPNVRVLVDGTVADVTMIGGRNDHHAKGSLKRVDMDDTCEPAHGLLPVLNDPMRGFDAVEANEGRTYLRATFPNVIARSTWATPPPRRVRAGSKFEVRLRPPLPLGEGPEDLANAAVVHLDGGPRWPAQVKPGGAVAIEVPRDLAPIETNLVLESHQRAVPAHTCTARSCTAWVEVYLTAQVAIDPP